MSLKDWERNGWVIPHSPSANEIRDLLGVVERDLADSAAENLENAKGGQVSEWLFAAWWHSESPNLTPQGDSSGD